ncbi:acyltransferase family protein [Pseudomonas sp. CFBP 8770]|uniref:acyltransferase n=1 Tax=unclassified Pseudomonas TaxID=196821 RepID=UPI0017822D97|nr:MULTISPECIES: acyltransferase family protein [unclassified Pseudomonas]MBD8472765.1 acyltransferase family protein [Pseudomonas sp. CFBP 8773]MBD8646133.1 acyltransferase family protein [Pseudomonas sp. CFBP 8770]
MLQLPRRVGVPLVAWSVLNLCWFEYTGTHFDNWPAAILQAPVVPHLWYLYTLLGIYLFLPVLAGFFQIQNTGAQLLTVLCWFLGSSVAPLMYVFTGRVHVGLDWSFLPLYGGYVVVGALLFHKLPSTWLRLAPAAALWGISSAAIAYLTWSHSLAVGRADETFYAYSSPFVITAAIGAFCFIRVFFVRLMQMSPSLSRLTIALSKSSFGIYLIHVLVIFWFDLNGLNYNFINAWLAIPVTVVAVLAGSTMLTMLLARIPYLRGIVPG